MTTAVQASLTGGELSPALFGHVDLARYQNSLETCLNYVVNPYGGATSRPGFEHVALCKAGATAVRLIPFVYSSTQTYVLELGNYYLRIHTNGGPVLSAGVPVEVVTPWPSTELWNISFAQSADLMTLVHQQYAPQELKRLSATSWTLTAKTLEKGPFLSANFERNLTIFSDKAKGNTTLRADGEVFDATHVGRLLRLEQKNAGTAWTPGESIDLTRGTVFRRANGLYYRALSSGNCGQNIPVGQTDFWDDGGVTWAYSNAGFGVLTVTSVTDAYTAQALIISGYELPGELVATTSSAVYGVATNCTGAATDTGETQISVAGALWGTDDIGKTGPFRLKIRRNLNGTYRNITETYDGSVIGTNSAVLGVAYWDLLSEVPTGLLLQVYPPVFSDSGPIASKFASWKWAWGAFGPTANGGPGWPGAVCYHQQRLVFAGSVAYPDTVWMSRTADYSDFSQGQPLLDDDAVIFTLANNRVDEVQGLLQLNRLMALTSGSMWSIGGSKDDTLTPSSLQARHQVYLGASKLPPVGVGSSFLFVWSRGHGISELRRMDYSDDYQSLDLTTYARHLIEGKTIVDWTYQQVPWSCVWSVRSDGTLLGTSYLRDQEVLAWHQHTTAGTFESVCAVPEDADDRLYAVVLRGTTRSVERMANRLIVDEKLTNFLDSSITATSTTPFTTVAGLTWLAGQTVSALADGGVLTGLVVSAGGVLTLPYACTKAVIGLPYTGRIKTLALAPAGAATIRAKEKLITAVKLMLKDSRSSWVGTSYDRMYQMKINAMPTGLGAPVIQSGIVEVQTDSTWERNGVICIEHRDPTPSEILAIIPEVTVGG